MKCAECGKEIKNDHYINGVAYGYNCYKQKLAIIYKKFEDEKNAEYSVKCFSAIVIFENKKSNSFHDSICKQWNDCKKLTARQLECIIKGFTDSEKIMFYVTWQSLSSDEGLKRGISSWIESIIYKNNSWLEYMENEEVNNALLYDKKSGFHYCKDIEDDESQIFIRDNGKYIRSEKRFNDVLFLQEDIKDEYIEVLKVINTTKEKMIPIF